MAYFRPLNSLKRANSRIATNATMTKFITYPVYKEKTTRVPHLDGYKPA
jgi:hypothetical protein